MKKGDRVRIHYGPNGGKLGTILRRWPHASDKAWLVELDDCPAPTTGTTIGSVMTRNVMAFEFNLMLSIETEGW